MVVGGREGNELFDSVNLDWNFIRGVRWIKFVVVDKCPYRVV